MSTLITADIHLSDSPDDEYRWGLFDWIEKNVIRWGIHRLIICGDLTVAKDRHSAKLTNRIAFRLRRLIKNSHIEVIFLKGNHDYYDPEYPFFRFLGLIPGVKMISKPTEIVMQMDGIKVNCLFLPTSDDYKKDWAEFDFKKFVGLIFCHQTFEYAVSENGTKLRGIPLSVFGSLPAKSRVISGDIHVPQKIGRIEYVGAPYHTRFGDRFKPRCLLFRLGAWKDVHYPSPRKRTFTLDKIEQFDEKAKKLNPGDHLRIRMNLTRAELATYPKMRAKLIEKVKDMDVRFFGIEPFLIEPERKDASVITNKTPEEIVEEWAEKKDLSPFAIKIGKRLLKDEPNDQGTGADQGNA